MPVVAAFPVRPVDGLIMIDLSGGELYVAAGFAERRHDRLQRLYAAVREFLVKAPPNGALVFRSVR